MRFAAAVPMIVCVLLWGSSFSRAESIVVTYEWDEVFTIFGHMPDPHVDGFDYFFSTDLVKTDEAGSETHRTGIECVGNGHEC